MPRRIFLSRTRCQRIRRRCERHPRIACRGVCFRRFSLLLEDRPLDASQAPDLTPHLDLGVTVSLQNRLGDIPQEMIVAIAMRHAWEFHSDRGYEGILLVRNPEANRLAQRDGPLPGLGHQPLDLIGRRGDQGLSEPHALLGQFPHDVEGLVPFLRLQTIDREDDLTNGFVVLSQGCGILLTCGEHGLVTLNVLGDGIVRELDRVGVPKLGLDVGDRDVA